MAHRIHRRGRASARGWLGRIIGTLTVAALLGLLPTPSAAAPASTTQPSANAEPSASAEPSEPEPPPRPQMLPMRQDEDWSALADPQLRTGPFDRLRYIELSDRHEAYLTLGGQARTAYELFVAEDHGAVPQDDSGSWLFRAMMHGSLQLGPHARGFAQILGAYQAGRDGGPTPVDVDRLDLHQGFGQVAIGDPRRSDRSSLMIRFGRQELSYGQGRLVDLRDGPTVRRSFDAILGRLSTPWVLVDGLLALEVPTNPGIFDDVGPDRPRLYGVYLRTRPERLRGVGLDGYYLGVDQSGLVYTDGPGAERRHSLGARWWSTSPTLRHDLEITYQLGRFEPLAPGPDTKIRAWGVAGSVARAFIPDGLRPELSLSAGVTSGDGSNRDGVLETFRSPFPNLRFSGATSRLGPSNLYGANLGFGLNPAPTVHLELIGRTFLRTSTRDAIYSPVGFPSRMSASEASFVGANAALLALWFPGEHIGVYSMVEGFVPGAFIRSASASSPSMFVTLGTNLQF